MYKVEITQGPGKKGTVACLKRVAVPDKPSLNTLRAEVDSMKRLAGHRHIVSYIDSHAARLSGGQGYEVFVLMEYCANGGLIDFMNTRLRERLSEHEILRIMGEVTEGVAVMHALNPPLIHRDIKIENVLIAGNGDYKLCDFGSASPVLRPPRNADEFSILQNDVLKNTTPQYRSPEMLDLYRGMPIDDKADVWALGVFLYKLCYYTTPFESKGDSGILSAKFVFPQRPAYSDRLKNLISVLLREDPRRRPNAYQTLEEVCRMRGVKVTIADYTKTRQLAVPQKPSLELKGASPTPLPSMATQPPQKYKGSSLSASALQPVSSVSSQVSLVSSNISSNRRVSAKAEIPAAKKLEGKHNKLAMTKSQGPPTGPPRPKTFINFGSLNKSMGSLSLRSSDPTGPSKSRYVDSVVQTEDNEETPVVQPKSRPKSMYVKTAQEPAELQRIITGLSTKSTTVELSPGENHIDSNVDFLKSLQHQDSGKSWIQQNTGGSVSSNLRRISTGSRKSASLIGQLTGKLTRSHSRSSSRASSIHEAQDMSGSLNGSTGATKYRSSSESIEEEPSKATKLTRASSIQRRIQGLLNGNGDPPVVKTAKGYGNDALKTMVDSDGFKKPALLKRKPPPVMPRKISPETPPLSAQSTPSTVTKTPQGMVSGSEASDSPLKKAPPKPKKPTYLKANSKTSQLPAGDLTLTRTLSNYSRVSDVSIPDIDDLEKNFHDRFPSAP